ncbi:hypothetical protein [Iodobacter ciconiae]|uniref:Uncharacterized protein n=1 Tax=Iodobacter ciconiae TaxID=2496266 RepID=A0A3S8ZWS1_9NEIS|nr:hypothetical protein [Iodobacter ciconiae]AZN37967.1 hypothetical protein EJO50_16725 [Iodobacter ciconiae]
MPERAGDLLHLSFDPIKPMRMLLKWSAVLARCAISVQFPAYELIGKCSGDLMRIKGEPAFAIRDKKVKLICYWPKISREN